jgi:malate synthase
MNATLVAEQQSLPRVTGKVTPQFAEILTPEALAFVAMLHRRFDGRRQELLAARAARQKAFDAGQLPDFLAATKGIRDGDWTIAAQPKDLLDRRVEITGPTDRKMVINALNCGASTFMWVSTRCQPRGRTMRTAVFSFSL